MKRNSPRSATRGPAGRPTIVVLGIDPGTLVTGYGIIALRNPELRLLASGTIRNDPRHPMPLRLEHIYTELQQLIARYHPDGCAIESAFYGKNAQSALKLGHARGVSMLAAAERKIPTYEYSPREVKKAVVGNGTASKEQVQFMVKSLLRVANTPMLLDASDAIAIALCHLHRLTTPASTHKDWNSFIATHPERVVQ